MGYREDPHAREQLKTAVQGFFLGVAFLLVIGTIAYFLATRQGDEGGEEHARAPVELVSSQEAAA